MTTIQNTPPQAISSLEALGKIPKITAPHKSFTDGPSSNFMDSIVEQSRVPIGKLDSAIKGKLKDLETDAGNIGLMIQLQLEVGKRSLMISTTTGSLKTAKDDAATVARAI